jgi:hypothetical protein
MPSFLFRETDRAGPCRLRHDNNHDGQRKDDQAERNDQQIKLMDQRIAPPNFFCLAVN